MNLSNENTFIYQDMLGEGRLDTEEPSGRSGWSTSALLKMPNPYENKNKFSLSCSKGDLMIRAQTKDCWVLIESAVRRKDLTIGIFEHHLICDICPQFKDLFSPVNQSNPVPWIPLSSLRLAWTQALARGWSRWAQSLQTLLQLTCVSHSQGGFTFPPALWLSVLLWGSLTVINTIRVLPPSDLC